MATAFHLAELFKSRILSVLTEELFHFTSPPTHEEEPNSKKERKRKRMDVPPKSGRRRMSYPLNSLSTVDLATDIPDPAELLQADNYSY